jgi:murein DD-endopeptidase MepM/ murein hydrolase activator NlpD
MSAIPPRQRAVRGARLLAFGVVVACSVGLATPSTTALATPGHATSAPGATDPKKAKKQVDKEVEALKDQLEDTSTDLKNAYLALRRTQAALPQAQSVLDAATAAQSKADAHNDEMAVRLDVAKANEARARDQLAGTRKELADSRTRVARFASQLYQDQGMGQLSVALSATTPDEFASRVELTDTVMDVQNQSLAKLATARAAATAQEAHITALKEQVAAAKKAAEAALAKATRARAAAAAAKAKLDALAAQQAAQSRALAAQKLAETRKLQQAQREQAHLQAVLAARARAAKAAAAKRAAALRKAGKPVPPSPRGDGFLSAPSGGWISSEFGMRYHPILHYSRLHAGRDYAANCGTPIRAAGPGRVISAGWAGGYGQRVMVDHGIVRGVNLVTAYNHMSRIVTRGGTVSRGQVVGYVGTTGTSTGCHLHFETYEDGTPKDPRRWL